MTKDEAIEFLMQDGNLRVPCSRYGHVTSDCAEVAWAALQAMKTATEVEDEVAELDHLMGLVVNDHDDIEYLILNYGTDEGRALLDD